jgi:hypothetical protein
MGKERRGGPVEVLRNLAVSLERLAAHEAASSVMRGAAEGIREELPDEIEGQLRALLQDALTVLGRMAHEAASREPVEPGDTAHTLAAAATQGIIEVLEREWQNGGMPLHSLVERINRLFDEAVAFARSRTDEIRSPGERAQAMAEGMVRAAVRELHESLPALAEDLKALEPLGAGMASQVGRGLVEGLESKLQEDGDVLGRLMERAGRGLVRGLAAGMREELASSPLAREGTLRRASREVTGGVLEALGARLRRPFLAVAGAGSALMALTLFTRWRRA